MAQWPVRLVSALEVSLVQAFATLWRNMFRHFDCYPWKLAPAFDPQLPRADRQAIVQEFLTAPECCLDHGLCLPLRQYTANLDDYLEPIPVSDLAGENAPAPAGDPTLRLFLQTLFERSVVTSTQVELQFAGLSAWVSGGSKGPRLNLPALASRAVTATFADAVKRWRALPCNKASVARSSDGRARPAWTKAANLGHKTTYPHVLTRQVSRDMIAAGERLPTGRHPHALVAAEAKRRFALLPESEQDRWMAKAAGLRAVAKSLPAPIDRLEFPDQAGLCPGGPLGLSSRSGQFPMRPEIVHESIQAQKFADRVSKWSQQHSTRATADPAFPDSVQGTHPCVWDRQKQHGYRGCAGSRLRRRSRHARSISPQSIAVLCQPQKR